MNLHDRDVFVFVNAARNRMKILHCEEGDLVLYSLRIEIGRIRMSFSGESDGIAGSLGYKSLSSAAKSAMESLGIPEYSRALVCQITYLCPRNNR